ncbi:MAG: hypothetical protein AAF975_05525 [Spirochaetota bacterium]
MLVGYRYLPFAALCLLWLVSSCSLDSSPFGGESRSPFNADSLPIVDSLRYLPEDPHRMSASDMAFYKGKPWLVVESISPHFTEANGQSNDFYEDLDMRLSHMKYLVHTRGFAERLLRYAFVLQTKRPIQFTEQGLSSPHYRPLSKDYHINPLEVLLLVRNMSYPLRIARAMDLGRGVYTAFGGRLGNFKPRLPFTGWDPIEDGGFAPSTGGPYAGIRLNSVQASVEIDGVMHEVMHNWGYGDYVARHVPGGWPTSPHTKRESRGVPYGLQHIIDGYYRYEKRAPKYIEATKSGALPTIYDVKKTAILTDQYDTP